jgi:hypothetical protein
VGHGASGRIAEKSKVGKSKVEGGMVGYPARWTGLRGDCTVGAFEFLQKGTKYEAQAVVKMVGA